MLYCYQGIESYFYKIIHEKRNVLQFVTVLHKRLNMECLVIVFYKNEYTLEWDMEVFGKQWSRENIIKIRSF